METPITHISCKCGDLFEIDHTGTIYKILDQGEECGWPVGASLADYIADPECSNCFETLAFSIRCCCTEIATHYYDTVGRGPRGLCHEHASQFGYPQYLIELAPVAVRV